MLEEILDDSLNRVSATNQSPFSANPDYEKIQTQCAQLVSEWNSQDKDTRKTYSNQADFLKSRGARDLKDPELVPAKNMYLLMKEIRKRIDREDPLNLLGIEPLDFEEAALELVESIENTSEIREVYRLRKAATGESDNAGISAGEATKIKNCFSQGRELFLAGRNGSLMVKPLNFFYALTAYAYGIIILNNPLKYRKDMIPGSHGMSYLPREIRAQFGGDSPKGTFSELVGAFPTHLIKKSDVSFNIDCSKSIMDFYGTRFDVSLGTLLSMVPEMAAYYKLTTGRNSRCYPIEISRANDPRSLSWEFHIGNGEVRPPVEAIEQAFSGFAQSERHGKSIVTVPATRAPTIAACMYTDLHGRLWFIENPLHPIMLPEIAVHFLITSMFSNIMRYRPDEWGSVLINDVSSRISLLTRHYFSSFQRKFLLLVLRSVSRYIPYAM